MQVCWWVLCLSRERTDDAVDMAIKQALHHLATLNNHWRPILPPAAYLYAMGSVFDALLASVVKNILGLPSMEAQVCPTTSLLKPYYILTRVLFVFLFHLPHPSFFHTFNKNTVRFSSTSLLLFILYVLFISTAS